MRPFILVIFASCALVGCEPGPKELCDLLATHNAKPDKCESRLELQKAQDGAGYKKRVICIKAARNQTEADQCMADE